jgi:hypothetical protein
MVVIQRVRSAALRSKCDGCGALADVNEQVRNNGICLACRIERESTTVDFNEPEAAH